jgi:hypothetical protein
MLANALRSCGGRRGSRDGYEGRELTAIWSDGLSRCGPVPAKWTRWVHWFRSGSSDYARLPGECWIPVALPPPALHRRSVLRLAQGPARSPTTAPSCGLELWTARQHGNGRTFSPGALFSEPLDSADLVQRFEPAPDKHFLRCPTPEVGVSLALRTELAGSLIAARSKVLLQTE